ncbi:hypothetical protein BDF14DRAFT_1816798 [Spinellus fusiger]|nr:hypothetical protein BDF14DRAFT_1816798 [Spinellus fusiger]
MLSYSVVLRPHLSDPVSPYYGLAVIDCILSLCVWILCDNSLSLLQKPSLVLSRPLFFFFFLSFSSLFCHRNG